MKMKQVRKSVRSYVKHYAIGKPTIKAIVSKDSNYIKLSCGHSVHTHTNPRYTFRVGEVVNCNECSFNERNSRPKPIKRY